MRVSTPNAEPVKFGMPAAPLLMTVSRPAGSAKSRNAARQVWVEAKTSIREARRISESQAGVAGSSSSCGKAPAGERSRVAMNDADAHRADLRDADASAAARARRARSAARRLKIEQNFVRARTTPVVDGLRIGAAAACADVVAPRDLGFDIAAQALRYRATRRSISANHAGSASNQWKSPLNTIRGGVGSAAASRSTCVERREVAVKPADDVERLGDSISARAVEHRGRIVIIEPGRSGRRLPGCGAVRKAHSAASFSAPPQLEPWPAVQP